MTAATEFSEANVRRWMIGQLAQAARGDGDRDLLDSAGEVNCTRLAEQAAAHWGQDGLRGPLDDETHWIWDVAVRAATAHDRRR